MGNVTTTPPWQGSMRRLTRRARRLRRHSMRYESRSESRAIAGKSGKKARGGFARESFQGHGKRLGFVFSGERAIKERYHMLHARLAGIGCFKGSNRVWNVPHQRESELLALVRSPKVSLARNCPMHFDAINASLVQGADGPARLRLVRDRKLLKSELSPVENRTRPKNARTDQNARFDFDAPLIEFS
jgi:hypothetical protein